MLVTGLLVVAVAVAVAAITVAVLDRRGVAQVEHLRDPCVFGCFEGQNLNFLLVDWLEH